MPNKQPTKHFHDEDKLGDDNGNKFTGVGEEMRRQVDIMQIKIDSYIKIIGRLKDWKQRFGALDEIEQRVEVEFAKLASKVKTLSEELYDNEKLIKRLLKEKTEQNEKLVSFTQKKKKQEQQEMKLVGKSEEANQASTKCEELESELLDLKTEITT